LQFFGLLLGLPLVARAVLVTRLPDAVLLIDNRGNVVDANPPSLEVLNRSQSEVVGRHISNCLPTLAISNKAGSARLTNHHEVTLDSTGVVRNYDLLVAPQFLGGGYLAGWILVLRDVTAYKEIQRDLSEVNRQLEAAMTELRRTQEQVIQQERLRALGEM